jgi:hypothetical protein
MHMRILITLVGCALALLVGITPVGAVTGLNPTISGDVGPGSLDIDTFEAKCTTAVRFLDIFVKESLGDDQMGATAIAYAPTSMLGQGDSTVVSGFEDVLSLVRPTSLEGTMKALVGVFNVGGCADSFCDYTVRVNCVTGLGVHKSASLVRKQDE